MDLEQAERKLRENSALSALMKAPEGRALRAQFDEKALRAAVRQGDTAALQETLQRLLSTPEGRALAEKVRKAVDQP